MVIDEGPRQRLYSHLQELLGEEDTETLMKFFPPTGWGDVATKRDLDHLGQAIRGELAVHEARVESRLETGLATLEARLDTGLATLRAHIDTGLASQETRLQAGLARASLDTRASLRTLFLGLVGLQMSGAALAVAVARAG
ncbi:MAG: hypothetical protein ACRD0N_13880 [Acidimicrobiales bacterium]